jgi:hypothetical protein
MSSSKRFTVHLAEPALQALGQDADLGLSGRITEVALRFAALIDDGMPAFTAAEWCALCDSLNGYFLIYDHGTGSDMDPARHAWANVADAADGPDRLGEKWNVDGRALALRMRDMPYLQQVAACEVVRRFWRDPQLNDLDEVDLLRKVGARLAG